MTDTVVINVDRGGRLSFDAGARPFRVVIGWYDEGTTRIRDVVEVVARHSCAGSRPSSWRR